MVYFVHADHLNTPRLVTDTNEQHPLEMGLGSLRHHDA